MALFIEYPLIALLVAVVFAVLWQWRGRRAAAIAALVWGGYGVYELLMVSIAAVHKSLRRPTAGITGGAK